MGNALKKGWGMLLKNHSCLSARSIGDTAYGKQQIQEIIETTWEEIKAKSLASYRARSGAKDYIDYRNIVQDLTTIDSVEAWRTGLWK
jgi:hypothetical protein